MLYLTRTTNKVRKTKNIQLAIFQIPLDKFGKEIISNNVLNKPDKKVSFKNDTKKQTNIKTQKCKITLLLIKK